MSKIRKHFVIQDVVNNKYLISINDNDHSTWSTKIRDSMVFNSKGSAFEYIKSNYDLVFCTHYVKIIKIYS